MTMTLNKADTHKDRLLQHDSGLFTMKKREGPTNRQIEICRGHANVSHAKPVTGCHELLTKASTQPSSVWN